MTSSPKQFEQDSQTGVVVPAELKKAQDLANVLDTAVRMPVIGVNVGLDFLIGLIPGIGDATMTLAALRIVYLGRKMGVPEDVQSKMLRNVLVDFGLGFIPLFGDLVDIFYKANRNNVRLMEAHWLENHQGHIDNSTADKIAAWESKMREIEQQD